MDYTHNWLKQNPENSPVALWLLPAEVRPHIVAFYAFAHGADEIADSTYLSLTERKRALMSLEEELTKHANRDLPEFAQDFAVLMDEYPRLFSWALDLLSAFIQDTIKTRYHDYNDLLNYCQRSAASVGRALLYMCDEHDADLEAADALCNALQIFNHIQDCADDYVNHDRVYLPLDWFMFAGTDVGALASSDASPQLRLVLDRALDNCDRLLTKAQPLFATIKSTRVRINIRWIYYCAQKLCGLLRKRDPLQSHVRLGYVTKAICFIKALLAH